LLKAIYFKTMSEDFRVICLGGSAGGLEPYIDILRGVPADTGMAFVVAQHRGPDYPDMLPQLLATSTRMPVVQVEQGMHLQPNRVYVMPPRIDMTIEKNRFCLRNTERPPGWPKTINVFLCSLAEAMQQRSVAVILSGLDGDGSAALKTIKAVGGVTFAQSDAKFDSMPLTAVETGHIDYMLPALDIAKALTALATRPLPRPEPHLH
jgi:two-component system CheB/CheR fusion protein